MPWNEQGAKWIRRTRRLAIYMRDGFYCVYCCRSLLDMEPNAITLDHVDPTEYFGSVVNTNTNLVTACQHCNKSKKDLPLAEWTTGATLERVEYATSLVVPSMYAIAIVNTSRATKRRSAWHVAVRTAQAHCSVAALSRSIAPQRLRAVAQVNQSTA